MTFSFQQSFAFQNILSVSPSLLRVKKQAESWQVPIVHDQVGCLLQFLVQSTGAKALLEIGAGIGYSTLWMAQAPFVQTQDPAVFFDLIEANRDRCQILQKNITQYAPYIQSTIYPDKAQRFFATQNKIAAYDFVFLDSMKREYPELLSQIAVCLKGGGWLVVDNLLFQGRTFSDLAVVPTKYHAGVLALRRTIDLLQKNWQVWFIDIGDGVAVAQKK